MTGDEVRGKQPDLKAEGEGGAVTVAGMMTLIER
jgi:hypothetical protein